MDERVFRLAWGFVDLDWIKGDVISLADGLNLNGRFFNFLAGWSTANGRLGINFGATRFLDHYTREAASAYNRHRSLALNVPLRGTLA